MANTAITVDGVDICADYNMQLHSAPGLWNSLAGQDESIAIPRRAGELLTAADPVIGARDFTLEFMKRATSVAQRIADEDALGALCYGRVVELIRSDLVARARYGRVQQLEISPRGAQLAALVSAITIHVRCHDPLAYEIAPTTIAFGTTRTAIPAGNTPFAPRTLIANPTASTLTNFTLTQRNAGGDVVATMVLTGGLLTGEYLDLDHALMTINKVNASGTRSSARSWLTSGTYLTLRPGDQLEVDKGSGIAVYNKAYF